MPCRLRVEAHVPDLDAAQKPANNFSPLFEREGDKVLRRKDVNDLNDKHRTDAWWWADSGAVVSRTIQRSTPDTTRHYCQL